jgi:hypothetical protein
MKTDVVDEKALDLPDEKYSSRTDDASSKDEEAIDVLEIADEGPNALSRTQSRKSEIDPFSEPPDGGLNAWLKVLGCFLIYSNIWYDVRPCWRRNSL